MNRIMICVYELVCHDELNKSMDDRYINWWDAPKYWNNRQFNQYVNDWSGTEVLDFLDRYKVK